MKEVWADIEGFEGYYKVSNIGRVKSLGRTITRVDGKRRRVPGRNMSLVYSRGYTTVGLTKNGVTVRFFVHRLVGRAFIQNPKNKPFINHLDGVKDNNDVSNLEWVTRLENARHAWDTGLARWNSCNKYGKSQGELKSSAKLKNEDILFMRKNARVNGGTMTQQELGDTFGVTQSTVLAIVNGKAWKHIKSDIKRDMPISIYEVYKKGELIISGEAGYVANELGVKTSTLRGYAKPSYKKRQSSHPESKDGRLDVIRKTFHESEMRKGHRR